MRIGFRTEIDSLAAPSDDGEVLVWPSADAILRMAEENRRRRQAYVFELLGRPFQELIETQVAQTPVIMTGHQPAFIHPGVWIKGVAALQVAAKVEGRAEFLAVDSDAVHQLALEWPEESGGSYRVQKAAPAGGETPKTKSQKVKKSRSQNPERERSIGAAKCAQEDAIPRGWISGDLAYGQMPPWSADEWRAEFDGPLAACSRWGPELLEAFAAGFLADGASQAGTGLGYMDRWTRGMAATGLAIGLSPLPVCRVSKVFAVGRHDGIATLVGHLILHAEEFAASYNAALAGYRSRRGIRGRHHPIPDLLTTDGRIELPLWVVRGSEPRRRFMVSTEGDGSIGLWAGVEFVGRIGRQDAMANPREALRAVLADRELMPRALTLTLYTRLFACDLFVHGIGGAKYDQITDDLIRRFFHVDPPGYACISATVRLPLRLHDISEADRAAHRRRIRDVAWNPQRHLDGVLSDTLAGLVTERAQGVADSERLRRDAPGDRSGRLGAYQRIRRATTAIQAAAPDLAMAARADLERVERCLADNRVARSREWFFAMYPLGRLRGLIAALPFG